ncbi:MAG: ComEC/Rec2 family competence protein [Isosphaeraceae bacterium]
MTMTSTTKSPSLEVHILGAGKGESIVIKLPNGLWGVVDCYASSSADPDSNPTIAFLRSKGVTQLEFLCLTHPHDDHFFGMTTLIDEFKPREFWRAGCLSPQHIKLVARYYRIAGISDGVAKFTKSSKELVGVYAKIREKAEANEVKVKRAQSLMTLYPDPAAMTGEFQIDCIAPSGSLAEHYEGAVWSCIDENNETVETLTRSHHNNISLVLRLVYGKTRVLLGGDLEKQGWEEVVREYGAANLAACAVKVSHHGSPNGYCTGLWQHFAAQGKPVAVIAPSRTHKLPKPKAIQDIRDFTESVYATCDFDGGGVASPVRLPSKGPIESRLAMRDAFATTPKLPPTTKVGWCSMTFDDDGRVKLDVTPPAHQLQIAPRP